MIKFLATINNDDKKLLNSLKGQKFICYEYGQTEDSEEVILETEGNMRFHFENVTFDLNNKEYEPKDRNNDLAWFFIDEINSSNTFKPYGEGKVAKTIVNDVVSSVEVIQEHALMYDKTTKELVEDFTADHAIIIKTYSNVYMFYRTYIFDEFIHVVNHDNFEKVYPLEKAKIDWDNDQEYLDVVTREIISL